MASECLFCIYGFSSDLSSKACICRHLINGMWKDFFTAICCLDRNFSHVLRSSIITWALAALPEYISWYPWTIIISISCCHPCRGLSCPGRPLLLGSNIKHPAYLQLKKGQLLPLHADCNFRRQPLKDQFQLLIDSFVYFSPSVYTMQPAYVQWNS